MTAHTKAPQFSVGTLVTTSGYAGRIIRICEWTTGMVEIRLASGIVCVDVADVRLA